MSTPRSAAHPSAKSREHTPAAAHHSATSRGRVVIVIITVLNPTLAPPDDQRAVVRQFHDFDERKKRNADPEVQVSAQAAQDSRQRHRLL